jgi:hypothetical protein
MNRSLIVTTRESFERLMPTVSLIALILIVGIALFESIRAWLTGVDPQHLVPVFEMPIAQAGKALGKTLTDWMPDWSIPSPFGVFDVRNILLPTSYTSGLSCRLSCSCLPTV